MTDIECCNEMGGSVASNTAGEPTCAGLEMVGGQFETWFIPLGNACTYSTVDNSSSNPLNWAGINSFLSTLGSIAVPFLPFLFGTAQPPVGGAQSPTPDEYKNQQGMIVIVGFFILIALSVGAYIIIKKRR